MSNFNERLPETQFSLAQQILKDPYVFDFLTLKDRILAEYALRGIQKPIGVSDYELTHALPDNLKNSLPSIEELEAELLNDIENINNSPKESP